MKPFLGIDITENKKNDIFNGEEFVVEKPSEYMSEVLEDSTEEAVELIDKTELPLALRIIEWICGIVGMVLLFGIEVVIDEEVLTFSEVYNNAAILFWAAGVCILVWLVLLFLGHRKQKRVLNSEESENIFDKMDDVAENIFNELGVPENAPEVDILAFNYKMKNGIALPCKAEFENLSYRVFTDSDNLYLADLECKYSFSLNSLRGISTVNKRITISNWNKETDYNKGEYKQYKMSADKYECFVYLKPYHILELVHNGEEWGIYFPCYELPLIESLTGLTADK